MSTKQLNNNNKIEFFQILQEDDEFEEFDECKCNLLIFNIF